MQVSKMVFALLASTVLVAGCAKQRGAATEALNSVEKSLAEVKADAARYAPEGLKGVEAQYDRLKDSLEAKDYDNVLAGTPALSKAVDSLKSAVESGKAQIASAQKAAKSEWAGLKDEVPKMVDSIQARVDELSKAKRLPFGINKDEFAGAKSAFESMKSTWADASSQANAGDPVEATIKGKTAKGMGQEIIDQLKIKQS
jgi:hypothetical protein